MIGQQFSHYSISERLGEGGMGVVYRARDLTLHRDVALKFLSIDILDDRLAREKILQEARAISALNHPNICTIYEVGEAEGRPYLAMEYLEGHTLSREITAGGLSAEVLVRYGIQLAEALGHAHERGIVHRDFKPGNVIVTPEGRLKVLDFGLSKRVEQKVSEETTQYEGTGRPQNPLTGTLPYTAPELLRGQDADARSDIWALGVMLYEMAAGRRPFRGGTPYELSSAILRETPRPISPPLLSVLQSVIDKCLDKDPSQRYHSGGEVRAALETASTASRSKRVASTASTGQGAAVPVTQTQRRLLLGAAAIAALVLVLAGLRWSGRKPRAPAVRAPGAIQSLAVLPLENLSHDPEQEYFADGMTEALITYVAKIRTLRVTSRTSVMRYKRTNKPLSQIAHELNVDGVVEGSVERSGNRVRINAQLIDARSDRNLWAESYQNDLSDVLALQANVARAIAGEVQAQLTPEERAGLSNTHTVKPEAYEAYLHGLYSLNKRTPGDLHSALGSFQKAVDLDPTYALAYAGLADGYNLLEDQGELTPRAAMPRARAAANKALELDDSLAQAHASLAAIEWTYEWDLPAAGKQFERALSLDPNYATAREWYALYLTQVGRFDEAIAQMQRAHELDPLSLIIEVNLARCYYFARRYDQAIELLQPLEQSEPDFWIGHMILGQTYLVMGRLTEATRELERANALLPDYPRTLGVLGDAYGRAGRRSEAEKLSQELAKLSRTRYVSPVYSAMIRMGLGDKPQALAFLEKAYAERSDWMPQLNIEPEFDLLRTDPAFRTLLGRVARQPEKGARP